MEEEIKINETKENNDKDLDTLAYYLSGMNFIKIYYDIEKEDKTRF
jgi:hypothetical protein